MTTSVADLLDRLHKQAFAISHLPTRPAEDRWRAQAVVWPRLAQSTLRAMHNIPRGTAADQGLAVIDSILQPIASNRWFPVGIGPKPNTVPPDRRLVDMARVLGGIADLLTKPINGVASDPPTAAGLQANILAPVMVAAMWGLTTAPALEQNFVPRRHLHLVAGISATLSSVPPALRSGPYDDIAAVPRLEHGLDSAIHTWIGAAVEAVETRTGLSGVTLTTIAADLSVICTAAAATANAAIALGHLEEERGRPVVDAISDASRRWRLAANWPQTIYLGGARAADLADASANLRGTVADTLRDGKSWADPALIADRTPGQDLLAISRRAMHTAVEVAEQHHAAITNLFWGRDRVWMAARALEGQSYLNKAAYQARRRGLWVPMPRYEQAGLEVYRAATNAASATVSARQLAVATARPGLTTPELASAGTVDFAEGRIAPLGPGEPIPSVQWVTQKHPFGMGTGGPDPREPDPSVQR